MIRRNFFKSLLGSVVGLFVSQKVQQNLQASVPQEKLKRVFRWVKEESYQGSGWREIMWEDMKPGDEVIVLEDHGIEFNLGIERWKIKGNVDQTLPGSPVEVDDKATEDLTPEPTDTIITIDAVCRAIKHYAKSYTKENGSTLVLYGKSDDTLKAMQRDGELLIHVRDVDVVQERLGKIASWQPESK